MGDAGRTMRRSRGKIIDLFHARFDPKAGDAGRWQERQDAIVAKIEKALGGVESLDEDRILRHFLNAVQSALRTNYYQVDDSGRPKAQIAIKFSSRKLDGLSIPAKAAL